MLSLTDPATWAWLQPYLDEVFELEPEQRVQWLADLDKTSPPAAAELRTLLEEHAALDAAGFLDTSPTEQIRNEPLPERAHDAAMRAARILGATLPADHTLARTAQALIEKIENRH